MTHDNGRKWKWWLINSAQIKVIWAKSIVRTISTSSLFLIYQITFENKIHIKVPKAIPQNNIEINFHVPSKNVHPVILHHSRITHNTTKNKATAVQSLKRLSPSKRIVNRLGAPIDLKIDKTATGSVAEIKTQNNKQTKNGIWKPTNGKRKNNTIDIKAAEINNQKTDNTHIVFQFRNSCL